jgi:gag-polypeptide of LTR copia-type
MSAGQPQPIRTKLMHGIKRTELHYLRIADKLLVYVASVKTAKTAWETIKSLLETQGALGIVLARRKLFRAQCEEGTSIEEHIRTLRGYQKELHNLGQELKDGEFSIILLDDFP